MKKKIIFTSITAIVVFLFWIIEDVKREVESALSKYGIEFSGCSFIYPYLKFETVQYDDFYAYNAKLDLRKIISVDALSIERLKYYKKENSKIDYAKSKIKKRKFADIYKKVAFITAKYFNNISAYYFLPKKIIIKKIESEDISISDMNVSITGKKINAYCEINNTDFSIANTEILKDKTSVQLSFRSDLKTNIILKSNDNILNFVAQSEILKNDALKFFGNVRFNNYDKVRYELFVNDLGESVFLKIESKLGKLKLNLNCNADEILVGECYSELEKLCSFKLLTHKTEKIIGNNLGEILKKLNSKLQDSELLVDYKDYHLNFGMNFINDIFDLKICNESRNFSITLNKRFVDINATFEKDYSLKAQANINDDLNTITFKKILCSLKNDNISSNYAVCKIKNSNFSFDIPKVKFNDLKGDISLSCNIQNDFNSTISCKVKNLKLYDHNINGNVKFLIDNEEVRIKSNLETNTGFYLTATTEKSATNFKLSKNKNFVNISIPKKITLDEIFNIFSKEYFLIKAHLNLSELSDIISSGDLDIDLNLCDKNNINGVIKADKINIKDYKRGVILKDISAEFSGKKGELICEKSQIFDFDNKKAELKGSLIIKSLTDISLNAELPINNFCLVNGASLRLNCTGPLYVKGNLKQGFDITGNLVTDKADFNLLDLTKDYKNVFFNFNRIQNTPHSKNFLKDKLRFNIILNSNNLLIHNKILYIPLGGRLFLVGNGTTSLKGNMKALPNGYMMMFKKKLDVNIGNVSFLEKYPFEAFFTVKATQTISDVKLIIDIKKTTSDFSYKFYSMPKMSEDKLLAKILFNKDVDELTPLDWVQIAYVLKSVDENSIFSDIDDVTAKIGIDEIKLEQQDVKNHGTIKIGKNLSKSLSLSVENDIDNNVQKLRLRKQLNKLFSFEITTDGEVGVFYKYKY